MQHAWMLRHGAFSPVSPSDQGGVPSRYTLWGIVNATPDSFFDGGTHDSPEKALEHALGLFRSGARILDLGGASTRPGAGTVTPREEMRRVLPVLTGLHEYRTAGSKPAMLLSVDTWQASVAAEALEHGADIINDVSGFSWDPGLLSVLVQYAPGYVLTHCPEGFTPQTMQHAPAHGDVVDRVCSYFERKLKELTGAGLSEDHIMLDPGIGFGKAPAENFKLLSGIRELERFGRPVLAALSNKSLFGALLGLDKDSRTEATHICTALLASRGVFHHRVHDAEGAKMALILSENCTEWEVD